MQNSLIAIRRLALLTCIFDTLAPVRKETESCDLDSIEPSSESQRLCAFDSCFQNHMSAKPMQLVKLCIAAKMFRATLQSSNAAAANSDRHCCQALERSQRRTAWLDTARFRQNWEIHAVRSGSIDRTSQPAKLEIGFTLKAVNDAGNPNQVCRPA